jgi:CDP-paratose 2-epimerase
MNFERLPVRKSDQKVYIADISKAKKYFDWAPTLKSKDALNSMIDWVRKI